MDPFDLVAIDVDGVLRDASRLFYECHRRALRIVGLEEEFTGNFEVKDIWHFKGMGKFNNKRDSINTIYAIAKAGKLGKIRAMIYEPDAEDRISRLIESCPELPQKDELDKMVNEYVRTATANDAHSLVRIYPGVDDSIAKIRDAGMKTAIVSNSDITTLERDLKGMLPKFDCIVSSRDVKLLKPSGEGLKIVARMSSVDPKKTVYIGDTVVDGRAAKDAGCCSAAVLSGMGLESHLRNEKPDFIFKDLKEASNMIVDGRI